MVDLQVDLQEVHLFSANPWVYPLCPLDKPPQCLGLCMITPANLVSNARAQAEKVGSAPGAMR